MLDSAVGLVVFEGSGGVSFPDGAGFTAEKLTCLTQWLDWLSLRILVA